jgi:hypothetical protein
MSADVIELGRLSGRVQIVRALLKEFRRRDVHWKVEALENLGLVHEITGRKRERVFAYTSYLAILNEGTQLL